MIRIEGIPVVAARLAAALKQERMKQRKAMLKLSKTAVKARAPEEASEPKPPSRLSA
jgi:hypothetical protein